MLSVYTPKYFSLPVSGAFHDRKRHLQRELLRLYDTFGANDDLSIVKGSHQFAFGGHYMRSIEWSVAQAWSGGILYINGSFTGLACRTFSLET